MTSPDDRLKALFAAAEPPAADPAFSTAVMETVARTEFRRDMIVLAMVSLVGAAVLAMLWPILSPVLALVGQGLIPVAVAGAVALCVLVPLGGRGLAFLGADT